MQALIDFFTFKTFISLDVMRVCYFLGAILMPIASWGFVIWVKRRYMIVNTAYEQGKSWLLNLTSLRQRMLLLALFILAFLCAEIIWRMMFEYLLAYLQIRDVLIKLQAQGLQMRSIQ
jgi:hypothetical protein